MELRQRENIVIVPSNTEIVLCTETLIANGDETNGYGLKIVKQTYCRPTKFHLHQFSNIWLLFNPGEKLNVSRGCQNNSVISFNNYKISLAFGSLISPYLFKCAGSKFLFEGINGSKCKLFFARHNPHVDITIECLRFSLKREHIDHHRGVIIEFKSTLNIIVHICLQGNLDEYALQNDHKQRQFYLPNARGKEWQPTFSAMHLSIEGTQLNPDIIHKTLSYLIQFFHHYAIPIYFGSIKFSYKDFIYENNLTNPTDTFICQYAWQMLSSIGCRMHNQLINDDTLKHCLHQLSNQNNETLIYYIMERLRRMALSSESYFLKIQQELPTLLNHYEDFYLNSVFHRVDINWTNYVRIPRFCFTPTRRIIKPFKFMRSNRIFRYIPNVSKAMAFVEFHDDTGSAYLSKELVPFLKHYLENGFEFAGRRYIYLHHAQSQIRNKQFYFYCEKEGGMTREILEAWMGNFDQEKLPAKNTARRTQPFSSTETTIEIDREYVDTIPDVKTPDRKYNFTDGVGQISSELNLLVHEAIGIDADDGDYISSVLQIRYGGCKGTITVNPHLDGKTKQLLIRPSMNKFECNHQMLELCKRSLRRRLCLNREVINLLSYRGISSECLLVYQFRNILWLMASLVSNRSALTVLREKVLHVLPWTEISRHPNLFTEPFFRRLIHTTITNNLHQLTTRAHIRVPQARYMFGVVDEYKVLEEGQVFVQITNDDGTKTILEGPIAITKNPCRHPGDLRVLQAVNHESLYHLYDVLVFPQKGTRPHASEISGSDLDGDEYTVIWDPKLVPTSPNPTAYEYDSGPPPTPLSRVVTRSDRLKIILDICEQDNLGRLSNIHLVLVDKFGIDSEEAIDLAAGLSQELDSVKSGQHPYTLEKIKEINLTAGTTRPDFMQTPGYGEYQSDQILGKLFRYARHFTKTFEKALPITNNPIFVDPRLLHHDYKEHIHFARKLYQQYQQEMLEIIGSYGFSNEIDLFCCIESTNMNANERSDIQQTAQILLKEIFKHIRKEVFHSNQSDSEAQAKAAACYYVAYTDISTKDKRMLSFPWLFASQLLDNYSTIADDKETHDFMDKKFNFGPTIYRWLKQQVPFILNQIRNNKPYCTVEQLFEICFQNVYDIQDEKMIELIEMLIEQLIEISKNIQSN